MHTARVQYQNPSTGPSAFGVGSLVGRLGGDIILQ